MVKTGFCGGGLVACVLRFQQGRPINRKTRSTFQRSDQVSEGRVCRNNRGVGEAEEEYVVHCVLKLPRAVLLSSIGVFLEHSPAGMKLFYLL